MKTQISALAIACAMVGVASSASAAVELDQASFPPSGFVSFGYDRIANYGFSALEQTFTVGKTGVLDRIEVAVFNEPQHPGAGDVTVELLAAPFDYGSGASNPLAAGVWTSASLTESFQFTYSGLKVLDLSAAHIQVVAGQVLTFTLRGGDGAATWLVSSDYLGGERYRNDFPVGQPSQLFLPGYDIAFRTYVDVAAVPEPATWTMMLLGFGGVGAGLRAARSRRVVAVA